MRMLASMWCWNVRHHGITWPRYCMQSLHLLESWWNQSWFSIEPLECVAWVWVNVFKCSWETCGNHTKSWPWISIYSHTACGILIQQSHSILNQSAIQHSRISRIPAIFDLESLHFLLPHCALVYRHSFI